MKFDQDPSRTIHTVAASEDCNTLTITMVDGTKRVIESPYEIKWAYLPDYHSHFMIGLAIALLDANERIKALESAVAALGGGLK